MGEVACGVLAEGRLRIRDRVAVGPGRDGSWREATVGSVRRAKVRSDASRRENQVEVAGAGSLRRARTGCVAAAHSD